MDANSPTNPSMTPPPASAPASTHRSWVVLIVLLVLFGLLLAGGVYVLSRKAAKETKKNGSSNTVSQSNTSSNTPPTTASAPVLLGTAQFGSSEDDTADSVAVDATGIYVTGETEGNLEGTNAGDLSTATPGEAVGIGASHTFGLPDARDAYVAKYSLDGKTKLWAHQFGTPYRETPSDITINATGVYVGGETEGSLDATIQGELDVFLHKYTPDGTLVWAKQFGTKNRDESTWVVSDDTRICIGGGTLGSFDGFTKQGVEDIFARCYDPDGNVLWTLQFGSPGFEETLGATMDASGIYVVGATSSQIGADPQVGVEDIWFGQMSLDGKLLTTHQFGSKQTDFGHAIGVDAQNIYVGGRSEGKLPGESASGLSDAVVAAFARGASSPIWTDQFGTPAGDATQALVVDSNTGIWVIGSENGETEKHGTAPPTQDGYLRDYAPDGKLLWSTAIATSDYDEPRGIDLFDGILYVVGRTGGVMSGSNAGAWDAFITRYDVTP